MNLVWQDAAFSRLYRPVSSTLGAPFRAGNRGSAYSSSVADKAWHADHEGFWFCLDVMKLYI